ncbi:hypothetical protein Aph01nite_16850 [Acrocarpospora phusangensis]|uniref:Uncharacterized protein n=1 Tax=Acrocarpospora phusangensis TaxID=1070424 RepID=A0A919UP80_9ACTN|nr:hypothetical protein Aph01nite_16850 [Acrocarpospora phusangensis]
MEQPVGGVRIEPAAFGPDRELGRDDVTRGPLLRRNGESGRSVAGSSAIPEGAPITATDAGARIAASGDRSASWSPAWMLAGRTSHSSDMVRLQMWGAGSAADVSATRPRVAGLDDPSGKDFGRDLTHSGHM